MMNRFNHRLFVVSLMAYVLLLMTMGCGEDQVVEKIVNVPGDTVKVARKLDYNFIELFSIDAAEGEQSLQGSVRGDSIYLYWPQYMPLPEHITPLITLADKATVQPASAAQVDFKTGVTYTVTAENGNKKKYVLKVVINQPAPWFEATVGTVEVGTDMILNGDFFIPDATLTQVYLIAPGGTTATQITITQISETLIYATIPANLKPGAYQVRLQTGWRVTTDRLYETIDVLAAPI